MKRAIDQTVRDIKRGVNKTVLKVPRIERRVRDATSNESLGPQGSVLAEIAQASYNHYEYQIIMKIIWKRLRDTGKNWRHVFKGLTVLEYLVANGSERVIGEIRARIYLISALSGFQYIDSKGRDQGINVRRKSQSLIAIINDEDKLMEVREKAAASKDISSAGRPDSYSGYGDHNDDRHEDHFQHRDDNRREERYTDESQYGRGHDGRNGLENYKDDDNREHNGEDDNGYGLENKSSDEKHSLKKDDRDGGKAGCSSHDERSLEFKLVDQHAQQPPSYNEAIKNADKSSSDERMDGGTSIKPVQSNGSLPASANATTKPTMLFIDEGTDEFDDFDPRRPIPAGATVANNVEMNLFESAAPTVANNVEMDLFGSLPFEDSINALALVPATSISATTEPSVPTNPEFSSFFDRPNTNPFEDAPFHAIPQENSMNSLHNNIPSASFQHNFESISSSKPQPSAFETVEASPGQEFGECFPSIPPNPIIPNSQPTFTASGFQTVETPGVQTSYDILEGILPPNGPSSTFFPHNAMVVSSMRTPMDHSDAFERPSVSMPAASLEIFSNHHGQPEQLSQVTSQNNANSSGLTNESLRTFPPQGALSVPSSRTPTGHSDLLAQPAVTMPVAPVEVLQNHYGQPESFQVTSEYISNQSGPTNEPPDAFLPQAALSFAPTTTLAGRSDFPLLPTVPVPVSSQASLPQNYSQTEMPALAAPRNTNGASSNPSIQATHTGAPSTQIGDSDLFAQPTASHAVVSQAALPNHHGRQEILQVGPAQNLDSSALSSVVTVTGSSTGFALTPQASPASFGPPFTSQEVPSNTSGPTKKPSQSSDKFETKSAVWADTISRGLVNLNISGPKVNPLADIGVDFDSLNRKEKREKVKSTATPVSTVTMGKAMGTGTGIGRASATGLAPPPNPTIGSGMGWGGGSGMVISGFGGVNMGMGVNIGISQGPQGLAMLPNTGTLSGSAGPGVTGTGYNPIMSMNRYGSMPYGGAYR